MPAEPLLFHLHWSFWWGRTTLHRAALPVCLLRICKIFRVGLDHLLIAGLDLAGMPSLHQLQRFAWIARGASSFVACRPRLVLQCAFAICVRFPTLRGLPDMSFVKPLPQNPGQRGTESWIVIQQASCSWTSYAGCPSHRACEGSRRVKIQECTECKKKELISLVLVDVTDECLQTIWVLSTVLFCFSCFLVCSAFCRLAKHGSALKELQLRSWLAKMLWTSWEQTNAGPDADLQRYSRLENDRDLQTASQFCWYCTVQRLIDIRPVAPPRSWLQWWWHSASSRNSWNCFATLQNQGEAKPT